MLLKVIYALLLLAIVLYMLFGPQPRKAADTATDATTSGLAAYGPGRLVSVR